MDNEEIWDKINKNFKAYLELRDKTIYYNIPKQLKKINDLVISNYSGTERYNYDYKYNISFDESKMIILDFFTYLGNNLDIEYKNKIRNSADFIIINDQNNNKDMVKNGKIYISNDSTLKTTFTLCHEMTHLLINKKSDNIYYMLAGELNSLTFERLLNSFLRETIYKDDSDLFLIERNQKDIFLAGACEFFEMLKELYETKGYITKNNIKESIGKIDNNTKKELFRKNCNFYLNVILENRTNANLLYEKYVLADVLSATLMDRIKNEDKYLETYLKKYNDIIHIKDLFKILDELDLNFNNQDLYNEIHYSYNNKIKQLNIERHI